MFAPTACTTPTRLPTLWWTLAAALLLLSVFAPAFAAETRDQALDEPPIDGRPVHIAGWRLLPLEQSVRATLQRRADPATAHMLPLAVLPSQHSALWLGLSADRSSGARIELRWAVPLDGKVTAWRHLAD